VSITFASGTTKDLWIESNVELDRKADAWLYLLLPVAMQLGEDLEIQGKLSKSAVDSFYTAKKELLRGHPKMTDIELIYSEPLLEDISSKRQVGLFYSGGVDSTYAAETLADVSALVSVWGFDIPIKNERHWQLSLELIEPYAKSLNRELIQVRTNIRELTNGLLEWGGDYHGTALSGIATALANQLEKVYVAAGFVRQSPNWGHSPILYNAYSTASLSIEETDPVKRIAKAQYLANNPRTLTIRACYRNMHGKANCGVCKKCIRTRLEFDLVKARYRPPGLEQRPSAKEILSSKMTNWDYLFYLEAINWARTNSYKGTLKPLLITSLTRLKNKLRG